MNPGLFSSSPPKRRSILPAGAVGHQVVAGPVGKVNDILIVIGRDLGAGWDFPGGGLF